MSISRFLKAVVATGALICAGSTHSTAQFFVMDDGTLTQVLTEGVPDSVSFSDPDFVKAKATDGVIPQASQAVDLGLTSGTKWAPWNIGASKYSDPGAYIAWGETVGAKSSYDWSTYAHVEEGYDDDYHINKYQQADGSKDAIWYDEIGMFVGDGKTVLDAEDDAATVNWGSEWRMPTVAQFQELIDECTWEYVESGLTVGYLITGPSKKTIFIPAAGYRYGKNLYSFESTGYYWTSEVGSWTGHAKFLQAEWMEGNWATYYCGFSIRPVLVSGE